MSPHQPRRLWIGGTSGLAQTYFHAFPDESWLVTGRARPSWLSSQHIFCPIDFRDYSDSSPIHDELMNTDEGSTIDQIIVGIRPPLACFMTYEEASKEYALLLQGLDRFLTRLLAVHTKVSTLIHISSVAAVDHSKEQVELNESHATSSSNGSSSLVYPYDVFKRDSELLTERLAKERHIPRFTNLRISAIFSDSPNCIQCGALQLQSLLVSCAMTKAIDCNSARNVAHCLQAMLQAPQDRALEPVYYYTRCTQQPVPYVSHLRDYHYAYNIRYLLWIPVTLTVWFLKFFHWLATHHIHKLQLLDYLLIVSSQSHSFDNSLVHSQFEFEEESIVECFMRRRLLHRARILEAKEKQRFNKRGKQE
jgi:hypothetical protein